MGVGETGKGEEDLMVEGADFDPRRVQAREEVAGQGWTPFYLRLGGLGDRDGCGVSVVVVVARQAGFDSQEVGDIGL
jgi:hypothetical protein